MLHLIFYSPHVLAENQLPRIHQSFLMNSLLLRLPSNIIIGSTVGPTVSTSAATTETSNEKSNMHSRDNQIQICQPFTVVSSVSNKIHISFNLKVDRSAGHIIIYLLADTTIHYYPQCHQIQNKDTFIHPRMTRCSYNNE